MVESTKEKVASAFTLTTRPHEECINRLQGRLDDYTKARRKNTLSIIYCESCHKAVKVHQGHLDIGHLPTVLAGDGQCRRGQEREVDGDRDISGPPDKTD